MYNIDFSPLKIRLKMTYGVKDIGHILSLKGEVSKR